MRKYGFFVIQKHRKTTIWQWAAGLTLWPYWHIGKKQFYGNGNAPEPRRYSIRLSYDN